MSPVIILTNTSIFVNSNIYYSYNNNITLGVCSYMSTTNSTVSLKSSDTLLSFLCFYHSAVSLCSPPPFPASDLAGLATPPLPAAAIPGDGCLLGEVVVGGALVMFGRVGGHPHSTMTSSCTTRT